MHTNARDWLTEELRARPKNAELREDAAAASVALGALAVPLIVNVVVDTHGCRADLACTLNHGPSAVADVQPLAEGVRGNRVNAALESAQLVQDRRGIPSRAWIDFVSMRPMRPIHEDVRSGQRKRTGSDDVTPDNPHAHVSADMYIQPRLQMLSVE